MVKRSIILVILTISISSLLAQDRGPWYWIGKRPDTTNYVTSPCPGATSATVVPCAYGFGMDTRAAYGGGTNPTIYRVQNLNDSGANSLRAALEATEPRVVIFEISGYINLTSAIFIRNPYITIAGQTAPSPGITIRRSGADDDETIQFQTHDVLMQHLRIRPGVATCNSGATGYVDPSNNLPNNIVFDHMSVSWSTDEGFAYYYGTNFTLWRSIAAQGLHYDNSACGGGGGSSSHGMLVYTRTHYVSLIQNLFAMNVERNPYMVTGAWVNALNNVIYDWSTDWGITTGSNQGADGNFPWYLTAVGNRFITGPDTGNAYLFRHISVGTVIMGNQSYRSDNTYTNSFGGTTITDVGNSLSYNPDVGSPPSQVPIPSGYAPLASTATEAFVLSNSGARPLDRDAVDSNIISGVSNRNGTWVANETEAGGYPTLATNTRALTLPADPHHVNASGYTDLELWLQSYAWALQP